MRMDSIQRLVRIAVLSLILGAATIPLSLVVAQANPLLSFAGVALGMFVVQIGYPDLTQ